MGSIPSKQDSRPEARLLRDCYERYRAEFKKSVDTMDRIMRIEARTKQLIIPEPEIKEIRYHTQRLAWRVVLSTIIGGGAGYTLARYTIRYYISVATPLLRFGASVLGTSIGLSYGWSTGMEMHGKQILQRSNHVLNTLCRPASEFKPCLEDFKCRKFMENHSALRVMVDALAICEARRDRWADSAEGFGDFYGDAAGVDMVSGQVGYGNYGMKEEGKAFEPPDIEFVEPVFDEGPQARGNQEPERKRLR